MLTREVLLQARARIAPRIVQTPVLSSIALNRMVGCEIFFKCENFQTAGAFKYRGATNAVYSLSEEEASKGVVTHSSGNHGGALARAAQERGITANIVMPNNSLKAKIDAVRGYGANLILCEPTLEAREGTCAEVQKETGATLVHPYNDERVIAGQSSCSVELFEQVRDLTKNGELSTIMCPVGGGGLLSGTALSASYFSPSTRVVAAEPANANDAFQSFHSKTFVPVNKPNTIADGLRTSLGDRTFPIILENVDDIVTVEEETIIQAMRLLWTHLKIVVEVSTWWWLCRCAVVSSSSAVCYLFLCVCHQLHGSEERV